MAANKKVTRGLVAIEFAPLQSDGSPAETGFAVLGYTDPGSAKVTQDDPEITEFMAEELDQPLDVDAKEGKMNIAWNIVAPNAEGLHDVFGGTISTGTPKVWSKASTMEPLEGTLKITPRKGVGTQFNRVILYPKIDMDLSRAGQFKIMLMGRILEPETADPVMTVTNAA